MAEDPKTKKTLAATSYKKLVETAVTLTDNEGLDLKAAIIGLNQLLNEREEQINIEHLINGPFWTEVLVAIHRVLEREYGWVPTQSFTHPFTGKPIPITYAAINLGEGQSVNATNSMFKLPGLDVTVRPMIGGATSVVLDCYLKRKHEGEVQRFIKLVEAEVATNSIYRGKMLEVKFAWDENVGKDVMQIPKITKPPSMGREDLILPEMTHRYVDQELFQFTKHLATNRAHHLAMNRKVLLAGPYGTGKTLTAGVLAGTATKVGWTFFWFKPSPTDTRNPHHCLRQLLEMAKQYGPAVVFMEDIDELLGRERDARVNEVVNTLDGIIGKDAEVLFVATTNTPEALDPVTLRRFDLLVSFELPDAQAAERLVRLYAGAVLDPTTNLTEVGKMLSGHAPSVIASAVEAAKRAAIYRATETGTSPALDPIDVMASAAGRAHHVALINRPPRVDRTEVEQVADAVVVAAKLVSGTPTEGNGADRNSPWKAIPASASI